MAKAIRTLPGVDVFFNSQIGLVADRRVGLITNHAGVDAGLTSTIDRMHEDPDVNLVCLFGPEHGVRGAAQAGVEVGDAVDPRTQLPIFSLYSDTKKPSPKMLENVDTLIVDLQDIGCRYWTNLFTMSYALEAAAENDIEIIVFDRPSPITGLKPDGNILDMNFRSFVGGQPIPNRTGLTMGEAAQLFNSGFGIGAKLTVVPTMGWKRSMWFDQTGLPWVPPSPNMPTLDAALLYPGTCLIEGTTLSEGRGTTRPFEFLGAPWLDSHRLVDDLNGRQLPGVRFRPTFFVPTFQKHAGTQCSGMQVHVIDRDLVQPVRTGLHVLDAVYRQNPEEFGWAASHEKEGKHFIDLLAGTEELRSDIESGKDPDAIWQAWNRQLDPFLPKREKYLMYE